MQASKRDGGRERQKYLRAQKQEKVHYISHSAQVQVHVYLMYDFTFVQRNVPNVAWVCVSVVGMCLDQGVYVAYMFFSAQICIDVENLLLTKNVFLHSFCSSSLIHLFCCFTYFLCSLIPSSWVLLERTEERKTPFRKARWTTSPMRSVGSKSASSYVTCRYINCTSSHTWMYTVSLFLKTDKQTGCMSQVASGA